MPDVSRSDSQRSQPRVSFNRDVHVKRIVAGDGDGAVVRREPARRLSERRLRREAALVLSQADRLDCSATVAQPGVLPEKFYTLPVRKKHRRNSSESSQDPADGRRRHSEELGVTPGSAPRKPPRAFATKATKPKSSLLNLFRRPSFEEPKKSNLKRSHSDASYSRTRQAERKRTGSESEDVQGTTKTKKTQLSPIIEVSQREDYFAAKESNAKGDTDTVPPPRKRWNKPKAPAVPTSITDRNNETNKTLNKTEIVIIDVNQAKNISGKPKKYSSEALKNKIKSLTSRKDNKTKENNEKKILKVKHTNILDENKKLKESKVEHNTTQRPVDLTEVLRSTSPNSPENNKSPLIQEAIKSLENQLFKPAMIHSSQQPVDKLPLTKGHTVDTMVKRLSRDKYSPPPKTNIMITPTVTVQHNNNQPFSYTQPRASPERYAKNHEPSSPVIYAQVVCGNGESDARNKQTVHTVYANGKKHLPHSDSDEGLGYEDNTFGRNEKSFTHFGDEKREFFNAIDKFDEEFPITPKFKTSGFSNGYGYNEFSKTEKVIVDSSTRGRGDGMDSRRRESLTEPIENGFNAKTNGNRRDLSYRRDQLESRINRRLGERYSANADSPDFSPKPYSPVVNKYVETTRYYRHGSASPVGFSEKYSSETKIDRNGEKYHKESRTTSKLNDFNKYEYDSRHRYADEPKGRYDYDREPKSLDSQVSDYRSSPENVSGRKTYTSHTEHKNVHNKYRRDKVPKDKEHYKSNPEIHRLDDRNRYVSETYHDSLRRQRRENPSDAKTDGYFEHDNERKDKFGDSGIENDFRRDSGENVRVRAYRTKDPSNESEDEGFASSLLIASERQHTEDNIGNLRKRREYDSDERGFKDDTYKRTSRHEYVHRERSIDDGSHYDPRIDKDAGDRGTLKKVDKKPPKPVKKSSLEKVKQLFSRDSSKKQQNHLMVREESLRARYNEYPGDGRRDSNRRDYSDHSQNYDYSGRRRLSTPSPSPTRETNTLRHEKHSKLNGSGSWFKSLDRLSRKKAANDKIVHEEAPRSAAPPPPPTKSLRFFGDTDAESVGSDRQQSRSRHGARKPNALGHSSRDLHNISEEQLGKCDSDRGSRSSLKPPVSPARRMDTLKREERGRRKKNEGSSVESSTEGDSSQQSQRSVVYLHAATVGDIPGPGYLSRNGRKAASREELNSVGSSRMQPQVKTLSRSFSMLAPWKPRHHHEGLEVDYTQYNARPARNGKPSKGGSKTAKEISNIKKMSESRKSSQNLSTLGRHKSKENVSQTLNRRPKNDASRDSTTTLYKKREKGSKENSRYSRDDRKMSNKSMSVESLGGGRSSSMNGRDDKVSRSISMPRDPDKSAGWFNLNKKSKKTVSSQRL